MVDSMNARIERLAAVARDAVRFTAKAAKYAETCDDEDANEAYNAAVEANYGVIRAKDALEDANRAALKELDV
jgi:hypothetical protein